MILECYHIFKQIEQRPAMWTGEATLRSIHIYMSGYYHAMIENCIVKNAEKEELFFEWVAKKLGYYESTAGWVNMILAFCMDFDPQTIDWEEVFLTPVSKEQHLKSIACFYIFIDEFTREYENKKLYLLDK